jgi:hypothetical protein
MTESATATQIKQALRDLPEARLIDRDVITDVLLDLLKTATKETTP